MRRLAPRAIAFLGKYGFSEMMGQRNVAWGRQQFDFAGTMAWILPNPSGLNRGFTVDELVRRYAELRAVLDSTARTGTNIGWAARYRNQFPSHDHRKGTPDVLCSL
jgi:double-stranded uracil-DNA glycosylase